MGKKYTIIDSHCHIYPEKIAPRAVEAVDRFYGGLPSGHMDGTVKMLVQSSTAAGIDGCIVHSVATTPHQVTSINHFIANAVAASGGRFTGLGAMHPNAENPERDLEELIDLGLKGVKMHPDIQRFEADSTKAFRLYELIADRGLPLLLHTGDYRYDFSNPNRIGRILRTFPGLRLTGAHLGGWSVWEEAAAKLSDFPNYMVDTSSSLRYLGVERSREIIRIYGKDRVMFGTDYPMWPQSVDLDYMQKMELTEDEYQCIYWKNCATLYAMTAFLTGN